MEFTSVFPSSPSLGQRLLQRATATVARSGSETRGHQLAAPHALGAPAIAPQHPGSRPADAQHHHHHLHHHHRHEAAVLPVGDPGEGGGGDQARAEGGDAAPSTPDDDGEESVPGLFRQILGQNPELRTTLGLMERYIPCVILLATKLMFDHGTGLVVFVCLLITSFHSNAVVRQQVSRHDRRSVSALVAVMVYLVACIVLIYFVFQDEKLYNW